MYLRRYTDNRILPSIELFATKIESSGSGLFLSFEGNYIGTIWRNEENGRIEITALGKQ